MKKVYYEILEYNNGILNNMNYYAFPDILESKKYAEETYRYKIMELARKGDATHSYQLILTVLEDYQTTRYVLSDPESKNHRIEAEVLSELTGIPIRIPSWGKRLERMMGESTRAVDWQ